MEGINLGLIYVKSRYLSGEDDENKNMRIVALRFEISNRNLHDMRQVLLHARDKETRKTRQRK